MNTLADYLVSIRTKQDMRQHSSSFIEQRSPTHQCKPQRRSLAKEIWQIHKDSKRRANSTIDMDMPRLKRMKTIASVESSTTSSLSQSTDEPILSSEKLNQDSFQKSKPSGCTLQPYFTKEVDNHHHLAQCRFEFSRDLLDEISLNEMALSSTAVVEPLDSFSIISQITQDSSLEEGDDNEGEKYYDFHEYENGKDSTNNDEGESSSSQSSTSTYQNLESRTEVKTAELKEGAKLLLDLLSMP